METAPRLLSERIADVLALDHQAPAIEFDGRWYTWGELAATVDAVDALVEPGRHTGIILRNRPPHVGAVLGVLQAGGVVVTINPSRGIERTRDDIGGLALDVVMGSSADLDQFVPPSMPATRVDLGDLGSVPIVTPGPVDPGSTTDDGTAVLMLTSGTTGPPKRVPLSYATLARVLLDTRHYERDQRTDARLRSGVNVVNSPLVHLGGLFRVLQNINDGRSFVLLERFTVDGWYDAVRRHRPRTASLVPTALRMVLEADLDRAELASIRSVVSGTAPLSPDDADAFEAQYGIPVLTTYAATEFGGAVAGWNLADHQRYWAAKRGSVGRPHSGSQVRIVDEGDGHELDAGQVGLLEVKAVQLGDEGGWVRTTDLARLDDDGFLWVVGRADQAVIRGGFKVLPDDVRAALESHPEVRGASVIGRADDRLGAVPVAAVELKAQGTTVDDIVEFLGTRLAPYEVPTEIVLVEHLPRTESGKVDLGAVRTLLGA